MTAVLIWQGLPVKITYSQRKTIALHVKSGDIEIRAPKHTDLAFAQEFLESRSNWLEKALTEQDALKLQKIDYRLATKIPFMGFDVQLIKQEGSRPRWTLDNQGLVCTLPDLSNGIQTLALLNDFYQTQAKFWLIKKTLATVQAHGLQEKLTDVRFRRTKSKWGHCTAEGRIQYNWQIMMAPEAVIDYLVAHEVSHLQHLNHSQKFWQHVDKLHPTFKADRHWLRENGHRLSVD